ncbi:MAG: UDP-N-acetylmuramate dehydrogenase [Clostridia bacterium]
MEIQEIYEHLREKIPQSNIHMQEPMNKHTSFKIGGVADIFVKVSTIENLREIIEFAKEKQVPVTIMGNGSNLLVKDKGIRGITIQMDIQDMQIKEEADKVLVKVGSGVKLGMLAAKLQKNGIAGLEFASGIPGTIGGGIRMNAGAYGKEFKEIVVDTTCMREDGSTIILQNEDIDFSYRHSRFVQSHDIILEATLILEKGEPEAIKAKMMEYSQKRKEKQPIDMPSAGSTFKRGTNYISAQLIDQAGLKGYQVGGAMVSTKHAGFVVNTGNATAEDVLQLVDDVIKTVYEKFGKVLELEVEIVGE